ncbi:prepilin-type N-terminal cleavage/methylation domain-containing protein [Patescibacteria group bacterium AH-259-L07]|nr:prepilin-type N-terminal cleavage/methylation domain-containing protein [Patescibacteria group bacterium AH-259-L07]
MFRTNNNGFTLIELLIVIAVIAILAGVVFVALDPLTRFRDARDSRRWSEITEVLNALKVDQVDNQGTYLTAVAAMTAGEVYMVTDGGGTDCDGGNANCDTNVTTEVAAGDHCVDLAGLVTEGYLGDVPISPNGAGTWAVALSGYTLQRDATGIITVRACESENTTEIWVAR